jgi:hypothetical protein
MPLRFDFDGYGVGAAKVDTTQREEEPLMQKQSVGMNASAVAKEETALFEKCNTGAYIVHALLGIACISYLFIAQSGESVRIPFTSTVTSWETNVSMSTEKTSVGECTVAPSIIFPTEDETFKISNVEVSSGELDLNWLVTSFFLLSAGFQAYAGLYTNYRKRIEKDNENFIRFLEYSISASVMLVATALIGGVRNSDKLLQIAGLTFGTQILGLCAEQFMKMGANEMLVATVHFSAWITQICGYWPIITLFLRSVNTCNNGNKPPEFVTAIVWSQLALFMSFGAVQFVQTMFYVCMNKRKLNPALLEMAYVILSLGAKTTLALLLFINVIFRAAAAEA